MGFEFRAEAFNVFNHTEWGNIAGDSGSAGGDGNNTLGQRTASCAPVPRTMRASCNWA